MNLNNLDSEYIDLVKNIINNKEFLKLKNCEHHGTNRFEHSLNVSYKAYKYAKKHNLDYKEVAIGGLLHDFFLQENIGAKQRLTSAYNHPVKAVENASNLFSINDKEKDIIRTHMFPLNITIPHYKESWLVSFFDKKNAISELSYNYGKKVKNYGNLILLFLFNFMK